MTGASDPYTTRDKKPHATNKQLFSGLGYAAKFLPVRVLVSRQKACFELLASPLRPTSAPAYATFSLRVVRARPKKRTIASLLAAAKTCATISTMGESQRCEPEEKADCCLFMRAQAVLCTIPVLLRAVAD